MNDVSMLRTAASRTKACWDFFFPNHSSLFSPLQEDLEISKRRELDLDAEIKRMRTKLDTVTEGLKNGDEEVSHSCFSVRVTVQVKRIRLDAKRLKTQCQHEMKKTEKEMTKMKEKLGKV